MLLEIKEEAKLRMGKCLAALESELKKVRTGRAHPSFLESIMVDYYQHMTPLAQVANIAVEGPRTLAVTPFEKEMVAKVEKAIISSDLGLNPATAGTVIRVPLPPLTEERRKALAKLVRDEAERARIALRNIRRDANSDLKDLLKEKMIGEDEEHRGQQEIQQITDEYVAQIDQVIVQKEKDLMAV